ncbi:hypothetical protein HEB94_003764 [Actinopolymorpha pittospori]|uniref:Integrase catalytic domain-containing protein n=1 Tax=Actinopolymorpha pittospori TaxID=648752 RepID=A0A927RJ73_9ACTN|nr:hypothetical protein [Actinopolymorpha pittospori]
MKLLGATRLTKLLGPAKWTYYHLYVILDIYSRYVVGWLIAERESAVLAEKLLADTIAKHGIDREQLTVHADNGSAMASKPVAFLLADLGVTKTHSRPHLERQSLLRGAVPHPEVPARLPRQVRLDRRRSRVLPTLLHLVQHEALPLRHRLAPPHRRPLRTRRDPPRRPRPGAHRRSHPPPRTVRPQASRTTRPTNISMDQQTQPGTTS